MGLKVVPLTLKQMNAVVERLHRHHKPVQGHRFSLGCVNDAGELVGACSVGRPVSRCCPAYEVAEVTRLVTDGTKNACSILYAAAARACQAMGFKRIQTYILHSEPATSLKASGWRLDGTTAGRRWAHTSGPRRNDQPTCPKQRWVRDFALDQIEGFESQIRDLNAERSGIYKELKQDGFDTKAVRELVRLRKMDPGVRENYRETVDAYLAALGMLADTPLGRAALARQGFAVV